MARLQKGLKEAAREPGIRVGALESTSKDPRGPCQNSKRGGAPWLLGQGATPHKHHNVWGPDLGDPTEGQLLSGGSGSF